MTEAAPLTRRSDAAMTICGGQKRRGGTCTRPAGWGTDHVGRGKCKLHGGRSPSHRVKANREIVEDQLVAWGIARHVEPPDSLLECIYRSAGLASYFRSKVCELDEDDLIASNDLAVWLKLEREELDRLARFSKMALDAGIAERQVQIAERHATRIAQALEDALAAIDMPASQRGRLAREFGTRLLVLEAESSE